MLLLSTSIAVLLIMSTAGGSLICNWACQDTSECILNSQRCNGQVDCNDGSDELNCVACKDNNFLCNNGKCIPWISTCNSINNCGDNSDESSCDSSNESFGPGQFFGGFFGAIAGVLLLITGIIIAVLLTCVYNKKCPLHQQRRRRYQPPVVIVEPHEENTLENASLINRDEQGELMMHANG